MELCYRGSVNRWECDENDHLNVRFFVARHMQCLEAGIGQLGQSMSNMAGQVDVQHIRFLAEARIATPLSGYFGLFVSGGEVLVVTKLRQSFSQVLLCSCVHRLRPDISEQMLRLMAGKSNFFLDALPDNTGSRGVADEDSPYASLTLEEAGAFGFREIGKGVVQPSEVNAEGVSLRETIMGRISDAMPHLWGILDEGGGLLAPDEGGAVLEYRLHYHTPLQVGDILQVMSGIRTAGEKVQKFVHLLYNASDDRLAVSAEATGVRLDLVARKAKSLAPDTVAGLRRLQLKPLQGSF